MKKTKSDSRIQPVHYDFKWNIRNYLNYSNFLVMLVAILFTLAGMIYAFFFTPIYEAVAIVGTKNYHAISYPSKNLPATSFDLIHWDHYGAIQEVEMMKTERMMRLIAEKIDEGKNISISKVAQNLIKNVKYTILDSPISKNISKRDFPAVIKISFRERSANRASHVVNTIAMLFIERSKQREQEQIEEIIQQITLEQANIKDYLITAEHALTKIYPDNQILLSSSTNDLEREMGSQYQRLTQNLNHLNLRKQHVSGQMYLIESAPVPELPITYSRPVIIALSLVIGILFGYIVSIALN